MHHRHRPRTARQCTSVRSTRLLHIDAYTCFEGNGVKVCLVDPVQQQALHLIEYVVVRSLTLFVRRSISDPVPFSWQKRGPISPSGEGSITQSRPSLRPHVRILMSSISHI